MIHQIPIEKILFLDIETVPAVYRYEDLTESRRALFLQKERYRIEDKELDPSAHYGGRAGILAEFGQIICISAGYFTYAAGGLEFRVKSFCGDDEKSILRDFFQLISAYFSGFQLCGHNIKEFDVPYICRRGLVHGLSLPVSLQLYGKKPWEVNIIDTMELWKFGDHKSYTSLNLLAHVLEVPSPKGDIDGSQVARVYWEEGDLERIRVYCEKDVVTTARVFQRLRGEGYIEDEHVVHSG